MGRTSRTVAAATATALGVLAVGATAAGAEPEPIELNRLTAAATFTDDVRMSLHTKKSGHGNEVLNLGDPSGFVTAELRLQPGAMFPWHTHPGPVVVTVAQGELTYVRADDCVPRLYEQSTAFVDPGNRVHTAVNTSEGETLLYATFYDVEDPDVPTIRAATPAGCE
ncbi:MAG: cupin domain-containing protein, partial [Actinomycetes bacterium]|nr:cupin domain-containing protein [Actinomycetes bacterium]